MSGERTSFYKRNKQDKTIILMKNTNKKNKMLIRTVMEKHRVRGNKKTGKGLKHKS